MEMTAKNFRLVGEGNYDRQTARVIDHVLCGEPVTKKWLAERSELAEQMNATNLEVDRKAYWEHCHGAGSVVTREEGVL